MHLSLGELNTTYQSVYCTDKQLLYICFTTSRYCYS